MAQILRPDGTLLDIGRLSDQVYSLEDEKGEQHHWSVAAGYRLAQARGEICTISLSESGVTLQRIREHGACPERSRRIGLDEGHALTTDLTKPLLFVPFKGKSQLVDGWHRLLKALLLGIDLLPAYFLTEAEAEAILVCKLPPGQGIDWGQGAGDGGPKRL